ncbi:MAG: pilus assembly protein [Burkholderiales bacterium]|nr:pilus assembly protein [Burkholderiales bacterium]
MATFDWHSRARAASIHLSGSALVALLAAALVFVVWYPEPYDALAGGKSLFILIITVDVVMGPLITFAVFDRAKPVRELSRDLAVVLAMQLAALGYGMNTMFVARPVAMALEGDRLRVVSAVDVMREELPLAPPPLQSLPLWGPILLRTTVPTEGSAKFEAIQRALAGNDLGTRPRYWQPWDETARAELRSGAKPLGELPPGDASQRAALAAAIDKAKVAPAELRYVPVISRHVESIALVDTRTGELAGFAVFGRR